MKKRLKSILSSYRGKKEELIPILQEVQSEFGYLPLDTMALIAKFLKVPESRVYAVATFYAQFRFMPGGKKRILVCRGTACYVRGAPRILEDIEKRLGIHVGETTADMEYSLESVACIGACALSPCMMVNNEVLAKMTPKKIEEFFSSKPKKQKKR
ncbi:MAG: NADH-quinone oxidoreductase subunit NuoE [Candidatus Omnitrophota bacterium]